MGAPDAPVVFCHGLFGWGERELGGYPYFFCAERLRRDNADSLPRFIFTATGPISSLHDQACELFYQLKGGKTNYGREHSLKFGHARFSRDYTGHGQYPEWDEDHPLDFVAHSMGAPVVRMLQYLLESGFFTDEDAVEYRTSSRWIRSLTTVAGVHNGSTLTWILGSEEETGLVKKNAYLVKFLAKILERYARLESRHRKLAELYDLHLDQWGIDGGTTMLESVRNLFDTPAFVESEDWALYDLTPNAMEKWNALLVEYPGTWYTSYITRSTFSFFGLFDAPIPIFTHFFLIPFSFRIGWYRYRTKYWKEKMGRRWRANDGMCPSFSQGYPHIGRLAPFSKYKKSTIRETGKWYVRKKFSAVDHAEIAMLPHFWRIGSGKKIYRKIIDEIQKIRIQT